MLNVIRYVKDHVEEGTLDDLSTPSTFVWVDCYKPTINDLKLLSLKSGILIEDLKEALKDNERPKVVDLAGPCSLILFSSPAFEEEEVSTTPVFVYVSKQHNNVITIRSKNTKSISKIKDSLNSGKGLFDKGSSYFVYRLLDEILTTYFHVLDDIEETIENIEKLVYEEPNKRVVENIFNTKKTLIFFHKSLSANREVITSIEKEYISDIDKKYAKLFRSLYNDVVQLIDLVGTYRDILTGALDLYLSSVSNNLNTVLKKLTALTIIIMIPTFIASVYGMNFKFMPEISLKYGYVYVWILLISSAGLSYLYFKKMEWL
jgi:magnesium transporter